MHGGACIVRSVALCTLVVSLVAACHRTKHYETNVEVTRIATLRQDEAGKPVTLDVEVSYVDCPGTEMEVIRGGPDFAACVEKYKVGDNITLSIDHERAEGGHYKWTVRRVGDCIRVPDPADEAPYAIVRECDDWTVNGTRAGFQCRYIPEPKLVDKCPWFRRR